MDPLPPATLADELSRQRGWIERLARGLVRDDELARDLAQQACLLALERPPQRATSGASLAAWLARVTRTLARQLARGERRRAERERRASVERRGAASPATVDVVLRAALQQRVAQAVLELDEPLRSAVMLRYLDGLDAAVIGAATGVTPEAARKRVARGLEALRRRLEGELSDRGGLSAVAVLLPATRSAPAPLSGLAGLLAMSHGIKLAASVALAVAALGIAATWRSVVPPRAEPLASANASSLDRELAADAFAGGAVTHGTAVDSNGEERSVDAAIDRPIPVGSGGTGWLLRARLLDERGWPLARARLAVIGLDAAEARADRDGDAELALDATPPCVDPRIEGAEPFFVVVASAPGRAPHHWEIACGEPRAIELGEVRLLPIGALFGRVVDARGEPLRDVPVVAVPPRPDPASREEQELDGPDWAAAVANARSGDGGAFELRRVPPGRWRLWACEPGMLCACSAIVVVGSDASSDSDSNSEPIELVLRELPPANRIDGIALDPDGAPVEDIMVLVASERADGRSPSFEWSGSTDAEGRFRLGVRSGATYRLRAEDLRGTRASATLRGVAPGDAGVVLRVAPPRFLVVHVTDEAHRSATGAIVRSRGLDEASTRFHATKPGEPEGSVRVLVPEEAFELEVTAEGLLPTTWGPFDPASVPDELDCALRRAARVHGIVTAAGKPVARAVVQLVRTRAPGALDLIEGFPTRLDGTELQGVYSDERGRFELAILERREYVLFAEQDDFAATEIGPLALEAGRDVELDVELTAGGSVEGRVLVPEGESPAGISVRFARGDSRVHVARADAEGRYRIDHLAPGPFMVRASRIREERAAAGMAGIVETIEVPEDYALPSDCVVVAGEVTRYDVDLASQDLAVVEGRVLVDGVAPRRAVLGLLDAGAAWSAPLPEGATARVDPSGGFRLESHGLGPAQLACELGDGALAGVRVVRARRLERGTNRIDLELETAPLALHLGTRAEGALELVVRTRSGAVALRALHPDPAGEARLDAFPAGEVELYALPAGARPDDPMSWRLLARTELRAGEPGSLRVE